MMDKDFPFKEGDIVTIKDSHSVCGLRHGVKYFIADIREASSGTKISVGGGDLKQRQQEGSASSRAQGKYGRNLWALNWRYLRLVGECYECIYECKQREKCSLYTEQGE